MKGKLIKEIDNSFVLLMQNTNDLSGILASTNETNDEYTIGKLSLKNCQVIERGYDLDELADEFAKTKSSHSTFQNTHKRDFMEGFQKALELMGDKKFSEDDVILISEYVRVGLQITTIKTKKLVDEYLLLQQTEWDVEVCTLNDCYGDYNLCYSRHFDCKICTDTGIPKLDENGCLILKRI
jgi:hypothetical protein